jgi:hypothetical protein
VCAKGSDHRANGTRLARLDSQGIRGNEVRKHATGEPLHACDGAVRTQRSHSSCHGIRKKTAGMRADGSSAASRDVARRNVAQRPTSEHLDVCISSVSAQRLHNGLNGASVDGALPVFGI